MTTATSRVTVHMVASLDGFIARNDGDVSWLETTDAYEKGVDGAGPEEFIRQYIDCYVMGSRTYEHALELSRDYGWAYGDVPTFVFTHRDLPVERESVQLCSGGLQEFLDDRRKQNHRNVWLVGGAKLVRDFLRAGLVDEVRFMIAPIMLGEGTPFFDNIGQEQALHLKDVTAYRNGMVELWYEMKTAGEYAP